MSFDGNDESKTGGFADGWTAFLTEEGLDILLRTSAGESKGRLADLDEDGNLVGSMYEPGATDEAKPIHIIATPEAEDRFTLRCNNRTWNLRRPRGKEHYFAFLNQWPSKAEPVNSVKAMLAALKKKKK